MKRKSFMLALGILLLVAGGYHLWSGPTRQEVIQKVFKGQQTYDAFVTATNVTAQLLQVKPYENFDGQTNWTKLNAYTNGGNIRLSADEIQKIETLLQSPSSYGLERKKTAYRIMVCC